jgi:hypothetical protein
MPKQLKTLEQLQNDIETILNKCTSRTYIPQVDK